MNLKDWKGTVTVICDYMFKKAGANHWIGITLMTTTNLTLSWPHWSIR